MTHSSDKDNKSSPSVFLDAVSDVAPLKQDKIIPPLGKNRSIHLKTSERTNNAIPPLQAFLSDDYFPFHDEQQKFDLNYHQCSISKKIFSRLKKEHFDVEQILDLHGCTKEEAKKELLEFLGHCQRHSFRKIAIMPGQGHGILRQSLNIWLRQIPEILAFAESPQSRGGKGLIRILLARG